MRHYLLLGLSLALASCATQKALPHYTEAQKQAQRESLTFWQPTPAKPDSTSGPRVEPGSQADLIRRIFEGHPPVVQQELEAERDSLHYVQVPKPAPRRLFGLLPAKKPASTALGKCKGCTFIIGDGNTLAGKKAQVAAGAGAALVVADKKAGPVVLADSGADVKLATTTKGQAAAGEGISQQHEEVKPGPWPVIIGAVSVVGGIGLIYWLVAGGGALWVVGLFKRRKPETQA